MAKIIAVMTQKGGVGKTTTTYALAAVYRSKGYRVLAVDMDPQHNLSLGMGGEWEDRATIYHVLKNEVSARFAVQRTAVTDLIPSTTTLSGIELEFTGRDRQFLLKRALEPIEGNYDYILIDCPPGLGILSTNALVAANFVLIPTLSDLYSLQGLVELYETVTFVKGQAQPGDCRRAAGPVQRTHQAGTGTAGNSTDGMRKPEHSPVPDKDTLLRYSDRGAEHAVQSAGILQILQRGAGLYRPGQ